MKGEVQERLILLYTRLTKHETLRTEAVQVTPLQPRLPMVMSHQSPLLQTVHHQCGRVFRNSALVWCGAKIIGTSGIKNSKFLENHKSHMERVNSKYKYYLIPLSNN